MRAVAREDHGSWELTPFEGIGPLRFNMTRADVIARLGEPDVIVDDDPLLPTEGYRDAGVRVTYDQQRRVLVLQTIPGRGVSLRGVVVSGRQVDDIEHDLNEIGIRVQQSDEDPDSVVAPELGMHLYAPADGYRPNAVQGVMATRRDYAEIEAEADALEQRQG